MFYVKFLVALGINQAAVAEVTSENIQQTKNTSLAESSECSPGCALNAHCFQYSINFKQRYSECRCRDGYGQAGYWSRDDGKRASVSCESVSGPARYHTWLPVQTHGMVESFISAFLDKEYVTAADIKNFSKAKKSKSVHRISLGLSVALKNAMAVSSQPKSRFGSCLRKVNSSGVIVGSQKGTKYKSTMGVKNECSQWQRSWDSTWHTSLSAISRCFSDILDFFFVQDRRQCNALHRQLSRKISQFGKVVAKVCKRRCVNPSSLER